MRLKQHWLISAVAFATIGLLNTACGGVPNMEKAADSSILGLSADSSANNAAVLVQGNLSEAANDIRLLTRVLDDEVADYNFTVSPKLNATTSSAIAAISQHAAEVGPGGTLLISLGGHGSPDGGSQMNDGQLLYFSAIRQALTATLTTPIKRLVLVVFGCYSGSWINNINNSGNLPLTPAAWSEQNAQQAFDEFTTPEGVKLYEQLIVMTSSSSGELSYFTPGGNSHFIVGLAQSFDGLKQRSDSATVGDFINGVRRSVTSSTVSHAVYPAEVLSEPLFNSAMHQD